MKNRKANKTVDSYVVYVDSLENVAQEMLRQMVFNRGYV
jgi:nucleoside-triphosphatase THEP1